ncbi:type II secretion system F family protein [Actinomadura craniellae]|uniref:Type II secretion system F family protein n=1 Tax=Actinomadura craniellae TaxID=2231787 RepID=A0A365H765_9ACTN|nr:type II secretion system F family protein [Actinomadura craniellae]
MGRTRVGGRGSRSAGSGLAGRRADARRYGAAVLAGSAGAAVLGGWFGVLAGIGLAVGCAVVLGRLEPREVRLRRARLVADLPVAVDLLAACLRAGAPWGGAVEAVADAIGGPLGDELHAVAAQVRLGADPATAWSALTADPALAPLARAAARAVHSGTALAPALARLAHDQRRSAQQAATARARAAGVQAVAPLGLCFLPAFVFLGIVPAIAGIATTLLP